MKVSDIAAVVVGAAVVGEAVAADVTAADVAGAPGFVVTSAVAAAVVPTPPAALQVNLYDTKPGGGS